MLYNRSDLQKSNEKKILRKVKKRWVTVSMATFAAAGMSFVASEGTAAHADTVSDGTTQPGSATVSQQGQQTQQSVTVAQQGSSQQSSQGQQASTTQQTNAQSGTTTTQQSSEQSSQFNNVDETAKYTQQIQQGYQDAYQNKGNNSNTLSGQAANYYQAGYAGAQSAINAYNSATQGQGAGKQDYNYYGNTVTKQDGFQNDSVNANTGTQGSSNKRKTAGDNGNTSSNSANTQSSTQVQANPTDGTPLNNTNPNNVNQGGADNPKDSSNSVSTYESTMLNKINSSTNLSVKATSPTQAVNIPTANTDAIVNDRNKYANAIGLRKAFDQGVAYALIQQGMSDAETGKWQGVYAGSNGATQDYYLKSATNDTTNVYNQAYRGARDAMNKFFTNNSYNGNTSVSSSATNNTAYDAGFNDVVNQASQGIVYVQNSNQYSSIMTSYTSPNTVAGNVASGINVVRIANDMDMTGATNGENDGTVNTNFSTFTVDGQNHMVDFHGNNYTINRPGSGSLDVYLQNFQAMYGANYFGAFRAENGAVFHFSNINYVGPQLLSSYNNDTYFSGNVNVLVPTASTNYTSPFQNNVPIEGNGNQENLEVNNFILEPNSNYFGNTSPALGGTNVVVTGNFTLGENSKMTLIPRGGNSGAASIADSSTWGVWLKNAGASLNINKNATLNIIPQLYNNQKYLFGGAVYAGVQVSININGGTLNYEGYNGISGFYNQPIDIQGSNQTQINVINGGVMQVLMDSVPDTTLWNSYNGHQSTYDGLINNVGLGNFNVGSRGNLKVGVTNSDSTYNVPYYGPININSVGSNHVIFLKSGTVQQFQTTTGTSGTGKAGNINAFSVAITQADGTKQYLYNFTLNSGATTYTGVDFNGNQVSGTISGNKLEIADVPAVQFVGPLNKQVNGDGSTTVTAYAKLSNYKELNNQPIYVGVASSNSNGSYNQLTQMPNSTITDAYSKADPNTYTTTIDTTGYTGGIIPITYKIPAGTATNYIGMRLHYGINSVNSILTPQGYNSTVEGYQAGSNGKVVETQTGDMQIANGQTSNIQAGITDALADSIGSTTSNKDAEPFNTKTNSDYLASYSSIQSGYGSFDPSNPTQDITQLSAYINSSNPAAFAQGYNEAAYQAGLRDARFNQTNVQGNANYAEAQTQYNQAYQAALNNPGVSVQQLIQQNNLPTLTSNGTSATAVTTAISDAQGALAFIADEQAATINGTNYTSLNGDKAKIAAYNDAEQGYNNALSVANNADNPDANADKAETAGFEYGQSLINGGLSTSTPTSTSAHMNNLQAAIAGYNAAQAAINTAKTNGVSSNDAKATSHDGVSTDKYLGDLTAYKSIKFGAYTGLANKADTGLNTLEKVGYNAVVLPVATKLGQQAFINKSGSTPTGIAALSDAGKAAFTQAYNDAQTSFNAGKSDGLTNAETNNKTSNVPTSIPANIVNSDAYKLGYKGSVDGYSDGSSTSAGIQTAKDSSAAPVYMDAYTPAYNAGRQTAGGNDYVQYKQPKATDDNYVDGYNQAQTGHTDGYNDAKTNSNPTPTKSSSIPYVTGYNAGVADEKTDATTAANDQGYVDGANNYLKNYATGNISLPGKSDAYNANLNTGQQTAHQGLIDSSNLVVLDKHKYSNASQQSAYEAGYDQFNTVYLQWQNDTDNGHATQASDQNGWKVNATTNAVFQEVSSQLMGTNYSLDQQTANGQLYQDILSVYKPKATSDYNFGMQIATESSRQDNSQVSNFFQNQGKNDFVNGYKGIANNTGSVGYIAGQKAVNALNAGVSAVKANASAQNSDAQTQDAINGYLQGYKDEILNGGAQQVLPATYDRVYSDAYVQAANDARNSTIKSTALDAVQAKSGNPFTGNSIQNAIGSQVYNDVNSGFTDGSVAGAKPAHADDANYMAGFNAANKSNADFNKAESQNLPSSNASESDTYNGAADAINAVNTHGTMTPFAPDGVHSQAYINAYNKALTMANSSIAKAFNDMSSGKKQDNSSVDTVADKALYDNAYKADVRGYNAGVSGQQFPTNTLGQDGYQLGQNATAGYNAAVHKAIYNKDTANATSLTNYTSSLNGLQDAQANKPAQSNDPAYVYAYSQQKAVQNALSDLSKGTQTNKTAPTGTNDDTYNTAYQATVDGYTDGHQSTIAGSSNKQSDSRPVYTASYDQGMNAGRIQRGADDYTSNNVNNSIYNTDPQYKKGVDEASNGFYDGKAKTPAKSDTPSYQAGYIQGSGAADGIKQAATSSSKDTGLSSDGLNAYYGVKDAYAAVQNPSATTKPSDGKGITQNNAYNDAYNNAKTDAQNAENAGLQAFQAQSAQPTSDGSIKQDATLDGYNQSKAGYEDARTGHANIANTNPSYQAGIAMANNVSQGETAANNNTSTSNAVQAAASQAYKDAVNNVKAGTPDATPTVSDPAQAQAYHDAYNDALTTAKATANTAASDYLNANGKSGQSDLQSQLHDAEYDKANAGFTDGMKNANKSNPTDIAYNKTYTAGQSVAQAIADQKLGKNDDSKATDKTSYDNAVIGYQDGVNSILNGQGNPAQSTPAYTAAYNQAVTDSNAAYNDGSSQALSNLYGQTSAKQTYANSNLQTLANNGFNDVKAGFESILTGQTAPNTNSSTQAGMQLAQSANRVITEELSNQTPEIIPATVKSEIDKGLQAAQSAVSSNPSTDATQVPTGLSDLAQVAYSKAVTAYEKKYNDGISQAKAQSGEPTETNAKKGYDDFMDGLKSVITPNATAISNPNAGQQAGINAKSSYDTAYNMGLAGQSTPQMSKDPIQQQANDGAQTAIADFGQGTKKSAADIANLPTIEQIAYNNAYAAAENAHETGAQQFVSGQSRPVGSQGISTAMAQGYDDANNGYQTAQAGKKFTDLTPDEQNNPSFMTGFNAATQGLSGLSDLENGKQPGSDKNEQDGYNGASDGFNAGKSGQPKPDLSGYSKPYQDAYNKAYAEGLNGSQAGYTDAMKPTTQATDLTKQTPLFAQAYKLGNDKANNEINAGVQDYKNNLAKPTGITDASKYGYNQAKAGYTNAGSSNKDSAYTAGSDLANALTTAESNVVNGTQPTSDAVADAQTAYEHGITDGTAGTGTHENDKSNNPRLTSDAYKAGLQAAQQARTSGASNFYYGNAPKPTGTDPISKAKEQGYQNASDGYNDGQANNSTPAKPNDADYMQGYNAGQAVRAARLNIQTSNGQHTATDTQMFTEATAAYQAAIDDFKSTPFPSSANNYHSHNNVNLDQEMYNSEFTHLQNEYKAGGNSFLTSNSPSVDTTLGQADNDATAAGYNAAKSAFASSLNTGNTVNMNADTSSATAQTLGSQAYNAINAIVANDTTPATDNNDINNAIKAAKDAALLGNYTKDPATVSQNASVQLVFSSALAKFHSAYQANIANEINGNRVDNSPIGQLAKTDADAVIKAGYNGQQNPAASADLQSAFIAGQQAKQGYTTAQTSDSLSANSSTSFTNGFNAAKQAMSDVARGTTTDTSVKPLTYQLAYDAANTQASQVSQNGSNAFTSGNARPTGDDSSSKVAQNAYDEAEKGYNDAKAGNEDKSNTDPSYQAGVKAYADAQKGIAYAQANKSVPTGNDVTPAEALAAQAAIDGYTGNDEKHPNNSLYDGVYKNAQSDSSQQQKAGAIDGNSTTPVTDVSKLTPLQKTSYDKGTNDAQQGFARAHDVVTADTPDNVSDNAKQAQNGAKAAYNDVLNNTSTPLTDKDPVFVAAYNKARDDAKQAVADGQHAANTATPITDGSSAHDKIAKHANDEYVAGYNDDKTNGNVNDPSYIAGQAEKAKVQNAINAYKQNPNNMDIDFSRVAEQSRNDAFMGATTPATITGDVDKIAKDDVYAQVHKLTEDNMKQGASDFITGTNPRSTGNDLRSLGQQKGFDQARQGFNDVINNDQGTGTSEYMSGVNAAKALQALESDKDNNATTATPVADKASYDDANAGYQAALNAWKNNPEATLTSDKPNDPVYTKAFNDVANKINDIKNKALIDGTNNVDTNAPKNADLKAVYDKYVDDTKNAIQHGANNDTAYKPNSSDGINKLFNGLIDANKAIQSFAKDGNNSDDTHTAGIIEKALNAVKAAPINASNTSSDNGSNAVDNAVYKNAVDTFKQEYKNGVKATIDGTMPANDDLAKQGATDATAAIKAGFNGTQNPNGNDDAYKAGQEAKQGYNEAQSNKRADGNASQSEQNGNTAVFDALTNQANGKQANNSNKPLTYQLAYDAAKNDATTLASNNANAFANGEPRPVGDDDATKVAQSAYDKAKQGYEDAKAGNTDKNNTDPSYQAGVKAYADAQKGVAYAQANKAVPTDGTSAEKLAAQALIDGYKGNDKAHPDNDIYSDFYAQGHNDDTKLQAQAAKDAMQSGNKKTDNLSPLQTESYNKGYNKANDGFNAVHDNLNGFTPDSDVNANDAQQGAKAGYQAVINGKDASLDGKDPVFIAAYNKAKADGENALQQGQAIALAKGTVADGNDADTTIKKHAFDNLNAGYKAAMNDTNTSSNDTSFKKGVELAGEVKAAIKDYEANPSNTNSELGKVADGAFNDAVNDEQDNKPTADANELAKSDVYDAIHADALDNARKGAKAFIAGEQDPKGANLAGKAFTQGYVQAKNGHDNANKNETGTQFFNAGHDAAIQGQSGATKFANADEPDDKFTGSTQPETDGYQGALQGYADATSDKAENAPQAKPTAYNDAYNAAYASAKDAEHQGALSALNLVNNKPTTPADNHAYALGATNVTSAINNAEQVNPNTDKDITNADAKDAFDATQAAITDGQVHKNADVSDKSTIYQTAYNNAFNKADKAQTAGLDAALAHKDNPVDRVNNAFDNVTDKAFKDANKAIYNVLDNGVTTVPNDANEATVKGHAVGVAMLAGTQDALAGKDNAQPTNADYTYAYNSAKLALQTGNSLVTSGKSFDKPTDIPVPANVDKDVYQTTLFNFLAGYKSGVDMQSKKAITGVIAQAAYDAGFKDGDSHANKDSLNETALNNFLAGTKQATFASDNDKQGYEKQYNDISQGFNDAINHKGMSGNDMAYSSGYNAGKDVLEGIKAAQTNHKNTFKYASNSTYAQAYKGYVDGLKNAQSTHHKPMKHVSRAYEVAYKLAMKTETRRQVNLGASDAVKYAKRHSVSSMPNISHQSQDYQKSYRTAFAKYVAKHAPKYVYNVKTIFEHNSKKFTANSRQTKFKYENRTNANVWRVRGVDFSKTGKLRYKVGNGKYITGNENFVQNAYYQNNFKEFKVIKPSGVFMYKSLHFTNGQRVMHVSQGQILHVKNVIRIGKGNMTRLELTNGHYVTSNKTFVIKAK